MSTRFIAEASNAPILSFKRFLSSVRICSNLMNYNVQQSATGSPDAIISFSPKSDLNSDEDKLIRIWAVGNPRVVVSFTEKETETLPETTAPTEAETTEN